MSYEAIVARVSDVRPLEGSDKIKLAIVQGYQIIVGLDVAEGELGLLFEGGGQLSADLCAANDLIRRKDEQGNPAGGMFEDSRRVKTIKLRGAKSEGFFGPLSLLTYTGYDLSKLKEGDRFSELNGKPVCSKYYTPATLRAMKRGQSAPRSNNMFAKHIETDNIKKTGAEIPTGAILHLSEKLHGCLTYNSDISMADGTKKHLNQVVVGDRVLGYEEGRVVESTVLQTFAGGKANKWLKVKVTRAELGIGNSYAAVTCTPNHWFWKPDIEDYVAAETLVPGDKVIHCKPVRVMTKIQQDVLLGKMLGDGSLVFGNSGGDVTFSHNEKDSEYLQYCEDLLGDISIRTPKVYTSGFGSVMHRSHVQRNHFINELFVDSKEKGGKRIPNWIVGNLTPLALAIWYMDDGSLAHHAGQEDRANFAVCRYTVEECERLIAALHDLGIKAILFQDSANRNRIRLNKDAASVMFELIAPYIPKCMTRKLPKRYEESLQEKPNIPTQQAVDWFVPTIQEVISVDDVTDSTNSERYDMETSTHNYFANNTLVHNTSARYSHVLEDRALRLNKIQKFLYKLLKKPTSKKEWAYLYGSRNVVLGKPGASTYYEDEGFRINVMKDVLLHKGEVVYGEIVGWESVDKPIMGRQDLSGLKNKALEKRFGKQITYSYGQLNGTAKFYVYRITMVNENGIVTELSKLQLDQRAKELGLSVVPHVETFIYDGDFANLLAKLEDLTEGKQEDPHGKQATPASSLDSSHLQEGIVVRVESEFGTKFYKSKSHIFLVCEGVAREDVNYVDAEEVS